MACDDGPAVEANPQTVTFAVPAAPAVDQAQVVVSATASSGLPVRFGCLSPRVCRVDSATGLVTALSSGTCTVTADQSGNTRYAPAPQATLDIVFVLIRESLAIAQVPSLNVFDRGTLLAVHSAGAAVAYTSTTPSICSVDIATGLVTALALGDCTVLASAGDKQVSQTLAIGPVVGPTIPGIPTGIAVSAGDSLATVVVRIGGTVSGGAPITGYTVESSPSGVVASGPVSPIVVDCPGSCAGLAFSVSATNDLGQGMPSSPVDVVTAYAVSATFYEPDTQPNNTIFVGAFTLDATTGTVSNLRGRLSESMTGGAVPYPNDTMTWLALDHQLSALPASIDGTAGLLVTAFALASTDTLSSAPSFGGTDGFSPGTGMGLYSGYPGPNPGNAYARIFVNLAEPTAPPTQAQIDKLAYADCTPGGMMGGTCMTGTSVAGYGSLGSMSGYPISQTTTKQTPN
jgi:hypothetical protein